MNKEEFSRVDDLLRSKAYEELSEKNKAFIDQEIGGEAAFRALQQLLNSLHSEREKVVKPGTRRELMRKFRRKNRSRMVSVLYMRTPAYANIIALAILLVAFWLLRPTRIVEQPVVVEGPTITDTVRIELPADTVFVTKTVRIEVPVYIAQEKPAEPQVEIQGSSLRNQKALMELLSETGR